jgi:hypothetical protein
MRGMFIVAGTVVALFAFFGTVIGLGMYRVRLAQRDADRQWAQAHEEKPTPAASIPQPAPTERIDTRPIIRLVPEAARLDGAPICLTNGAIAYWNASGASAQWQLDPPAFGKYRVELTYSCADRGRPLLLRAGDARLTSSTHPTGSWERYITADLGVIALSQPSTMLTIQSTNEGDGALMNLQLLRLLPTTGENAALPVVVAPVPATPHDGGIILTATDAQLHGSRIHLDGGDEKHIGSWTADDDWAQWSFDVQRAGRYRVDLTLASADATGGEFDVVVHRQTLSCRTKPTGDFDHYQCVTLGTAGLPTGQATLSIKPRGPFKVALMNVMKVELTPE